MCERRRHLRYDLTERAEYVIEKDIAGPPRNEYQRCVVNNISRSGICIQTFQPLERRQIIRFKSGILPLPFTLAIVRWAADIRNDNFTTGLMFL